MGDIPELKREQTVDVLLTDASGTRTVSLYGVSKATLSWIMTAYHSEGRITSNRMQEEAVYKKMSVYYPRLCPINIKKLLTNFVQNQMVHLDCHDYRKTVHRELRSGCHR